VIYASFETGGTAKAAITIDTILSKHRPTCPYDSAMVSSGQISGLFIRPPQKSRKARTPTPPPTSKPSDVSTSKDISLFNFEILMRYEIEKIIQMKLMATEQELLFFNTLDRDQDGKVSINELF